MDDLYREELMDVYKHPQNRGYIRDPSVEVFEKNPMCGDELTLQLKLQNDVIEEAKFYGNACVVSVVASEFLTEKLIGLTVDEASKLTKDDLLQMLNLNLTTSRIKCATLSLTALKKALAKYSKTQS
jgi:nitrogen fixation NifU-like protein